MISLVFLPWDYLLGSWICSGIGVWRSFALTNVFMCTLLDGQYSVLASFGIIFLQFIPSFYKNVLAGKALGFLL